jgi:hypothetical protein
MVAGRCRGDGYCNRKRRASARRFFIVFQHALKNLKLLIDRHEEETLDVIGFARIVALIPIGRERRAGVEHVINSKGQCGAGFRAESVDTTYHYNPG